MTAAKDKNKNETTDVVEEEPVLVGKVDEVPEGDADTVDHDDRDEPEETETQRLARDLATEMTREPKTGTPTPEAIRAQREREENTNRPQLPEAVNTEGELVSHNDEPPADVDIDDKRALISPPPTSSYVTLPDHFRDETENDQAEDHRTVIYNDSGEAVGERGHWVQVVQVWTYDDGSVPKVALRCECAREYNIDWTGEAVEEIVQISRT